MIRLLTEALFWGSVLIGLVVLNIAVLALAASIALY